MCAWAPPPASCASLASHDRIVGGGAQTQHTRARRPREHLAVTVYTRARAPPRRSARRLARRRLTARAQFSTSIGSASSFRDLRGASAAALYVPGLEGGMVIVGTVLLTVRSFSNADVTFRVDVA